MRVPANQQHGCLTDSAQDGLTENERVAIEDMTKKVKDGKTNYFQMAALPRVSPQER